MTEQRPVSELLPWLFLNEQADTVVNKDSSLMAVFEVKGIDEESADELGLETAGLVHDAALRYAAQLPVRIWHRIDRVPVKNYEFGTFTNKMAAEIDQFWGQGFAEGKDNFSNKTTISVSLATASNKRALMDLARDRVDQGESPLPAFFKALIERYKKGDSEVLGFTTEEELESALLRLEHNVLQPLQQKMHHLEMKRLTGDDLCGYLKSTTSSSAPGPVAYNPVGVSGRCPVGHMDRQQASRFSRTEWREKTVRRRFDAEVGAASELPGSIEQASLPSDRSNDRILLES
jgi:hypothetical protein